MNVHTCSISSLGYKRMYLPLCEMADTPFHIQGDDIYDRSHSNMSVHSLIGQVIRPFRFERVYLPLRKADYNPFDANGNKMNGV